MPIAEAVSFLAGAEILHESRCKLAVGSQLRRLASTIERPELVYVFLRLQQMERGLQSHESGYATYESRAVGCFRIPQRRGRLKVLDMSKDFLGVSLAQIDAIAGREILDIEVAVARSGLGGHPHQMSQDVG